jgi:hypothetical protein
MAIFLLRRELTDTARMMQAAASTGITMIGAPGTIKRNSSAQH